MEMFGQFDEMIRSLDSVSSVETRVQVLPVDVESEVLPVLPVDVDERVPPVPSMPACSMVIMVNNSTTEAKPQKADTCVEQMPTMPASMKTWPMFDTQNARASAHSLLNTDSSLNAVKKRKRVPRVQQAVESDIRGGLRLKSWLTEKILSSSNFEDCSNFKAKPKRECEDDLKLLHCPATTTMEASQASGVLRDTLCTGCGTRLVRKLVRETETPTSGTERQICKVRWQCRLQCRSLDVSVNRVPGGEV